eukprot:3937851-Rhodomonas_salina.7
MKTPLVLAKQHATYTTDSTSLGNTAVVHRQYSLFWLLRPLSIRVHINPGTHCQARSRNPGALCCALIMALRLRVRCL